MPFTRATLCLLSLAEIERAIAKLQDERAGAWNRDVGTLARIDGDLAVLKEERAYRVRDRMQQRRRDN